MDKKFLVAGLASMVAVAALACSSATAPAPAGGTAMVTPSDTLTITVNQTGSSNGLPRFCTASECAEIVYLSGQTDVLFNSKMTP